MARYTKEFKTEAVGQVLERGYSVREVHKKSMPDNRHGFAVD